MGRGALPRASRAALPALAAAALALAGCRVEVDGAPCRTPGDAADCPAGQACGNDLRCSARAEKCAATRCDFGAVSCGRADGDAAALQEKKRCTQADPVCGRWEYSPCETPGFECLLVGGSPSCQCPSIRGTEIVADPLGSGPSAMPYATGADAPRECRFGRLGDALAAAAAVKEAATVQVRGDPGPLVFGDAATDESFPLAVAPNVTLRGAPAPSGPTVIRAESVSTKDLVTLAGAMQGIRVETGVAIGRGIATSCGSVGDPPTPVTPAIDGVQVDGGGTLRAGISVAGWCGAAISGVDVAHIAGPALAIAADAGAPIDVTGSAFRESSSGVQASGGKLSIRQNPSTLVASSVQDNAGIGIKLSGSSTVMDATLDRVLVAQNGGTGLVVRALPSASKLGVSSCHVYSNGGTTPESYGPSTARRIGGGILLSQGSLSTFSFTGNLVYANAGDELAFESTQAWSISPGHCSLSNAFGCAADGGAAVAVVNGGSVDASYNVWPAIPWDVYIFGAVTVASYCAASSLESPIPTCP